MTLTLSEAIRLGSMNRPQGFYNLLTAEGGTCALGAALDAVGQLNAAATSLLLTGDAPQLDQWEPPNQTQHCPACGGTSIHLSWMIAHLNDTERWTREQIADWVETLEAKPVADPVAVLVAR